MSDANYSDARKVGWDEVPQSEIDRELAYWFNKRHAEVVWLVPCRYEDGQATCSGSTEFPYSDITRRKYTKSWRWVRE